MYRRCRKCEGKGTKKNENRSPEQSKEDLRVRTQCSKQRFKYIQNVSKIKENRGPEGSKIKDNLENRGPERYKIKENLALDGSWSSFWRLWAIWSEFYAKLDARCAKLGPRWRPYWRLDGHLGVNLGRFGIILSLTWWILEGAWEVLRRILETFWYMGGI